MTSADLSHGSPTLKSLHGTYGRVEWHVDKTAGTVTVAVCAANRVRQLPLDVLSVQVHTISKCHSWACPVSSTKLSLSC
jgi:hypothetical protein